MIALFAFHPKWCPVCGHGIKQNAHGKQDFDKHVTFECGHCGLKYSKADLEPMLEAADNSGSDLRGWV